MSDRKLFTWKNWVQVVLVIILVVGGRLYFEHRQHGTIDPVWFAILPLSACTMLGIAAAVFWWGNRPEKEDRE